ncbi:ncm [Bugula neritina]|uniref:Ncm n=1 Tax=Bugula neritina TaxID=10212 RepID=A0A7J7J090_BUGNE|nr:ncm [Bugula neritina]
MAANQVTAGLMMPVILVKVYNDFQCQVSLYFTLLEILRVMMLFCNLVVEDEEEEEAKQTIIDQTETNLVGLRRTIYLTLQSSLDYEEAAHKLLKLNLKPGQEVELCNMILDCSAQQRTYEKFYGLLAQRFCMLNKIYVEKFEEMFMTQYETCHRLDATKLRNVSKFFAHLLHTDAISWGVLQVCCTLVCCTVVCCTVVCCTVVCCTVVCCTI